MGTENMNDFGRTLGSVVNIYLDSRGAVSLYKMYLWFCFISQNKILLSRIFALLFDVLNLEVL